MKKYDLFISLGEKCFVAQTLETMNIRDKSYPFDWLEIKEHNKGGGLCDRIKMIKNGFAHFFDRKDLVTFTEEDTQIIYNTKTNLNFRHELTQNDLLDECYADISTKYARRCERLLNMLSSGKDILLIYSSSCFDLDNDQDIINALTDMRRSFKNPNIDLLVVRSDSSLDRKNKINIVNKNGIYFVTQVDMYKPTSNQQPSYYIETMTKIINSIAIPKHIVSGKTIVSLTSFPARINDIHIVIQSLMHQSVKPDKIVLYLTSGEFPDKKLPENLTNLQNDLFEIRWTDCNYRSYNKLVHALVQFPNNIIITVDDDVLYPKHLIRDLLREHKKHPKDICAHRIRTINIRDGIIQPYKTWKLSEKRGLFQKKIVHDYKNFFCGVGGVLYPPKALYKDVLNQELFTKLCKYQDDVWFWAMAVLNNRKISVTRFGYDMRARTIEKLQSVGLWNTINKSETSPNNVAIENIIKSYPEIKSKMGID